MGHSYQTSYFRVVKFLSYLVVCIKFIVAFNLDSKVPIVREGDRNSYFGFSIAQHFIQSTKEHVLIVGAPKANSSAQPTVNEPGIILQCPLSRLTSDCSRLSVDEAVVSKSDKSNQWLGVSVSSQNKEDGIALACAHRYKKVDTSYVYGQGICFSLDNNLEEDAPYEPCEGKPKTKGHEQYSLCQVGISCTISKAGVILLGSPGPHNWRGAVFKYSIEDAEDDNSTILGNSYLGMSVRIGERMFKDGQLAFIAGAPKSKQSGEVFIYKNEIKNTLQLVHRIVGPKFYSGFGYDFIVGDFNGDGRDDLIVGAPFYYEPGISGAIYIYLNSDDWKLSRPTRITNRRMKDSECIQLNCHDARFGFSLADIGDLNKDGYNDFVIGAPFEGNGAIYIFHGSKSKIETYSQRISAADIDRTGSLKSFGYSLSAGRDVDNNTYPDIAVGAYQSDKVLILRARPIVNIIATVETNPSTINPKITTCPDGKLFNCLQIKACLRFTAEPNDRFQERVKIKYRLEAEKFTGARVVRMYFGENFETYFVENTVTMQEQRLNAFVCSNHTAYLRPNNKDFLNPVALRLTYQLPDSNPPNANPSQPPPAFYSYPVLNSTSSSKDLQVSFIKNCGDDDICVSDLKLSVDVKLKKVDSEYQLSLGEDTELRLEATVTNSGEDAHETILRVTLPDNVNIIGSEVSSEGSQVSCIPIDKILECDLGNPVPEKRTVSVLIRLNPNQISSQQERITIGFAVNTTSTEKDRTDDILDISIKIFRIIDLTVIGSSDPSIVYYAPVEKTESTTTEKLKDDEEIGPEIVHKFEVKNTGKVTVQRSQLTITWPFTVFSPPNDTSYMMYILGKPKVEGNSRDLEGGQCRIDNMYINPLNVKIRGSDEDTIQVQPGDQEKRRKKRSNQEESRIGDLICGKSSRIECISINCNVYELRPSESALISIRMRLWNRTVSLHFPYANEVWAISTARISFSQSDSHIKQINADNDYGQAATKLISSEKKQQPVALWIIILSVCAGILVLIAIIIILWRCGFFKRNKPEQFPEHKAIVKSSEEDNQED